jgi:hypothetical protein
VHCEERPQGPQDDPSSLTPGVGFILKVEMAKALPLLTEEALSLP